ncbi:glycosyltransferase family 4 protein, partial [Nitrospinae bacterium AH-259-F20]|nr:glycosyltransferase family 4 protein [Nitrospinae bacterium AH-259-F20]
MKHRYYNSLNAFEEVHVVEFTVEPSDPSPMDMAFGKARLTVHPVGAMSPTALPSVWRELNRVVKTVRPDVIRAYDPSWCGALAVAVAQRWKRPIVVSIHTHFGDKRRVMGNRFGPVERALEQYTLRRADRVLCVSEHVLRYAQAMGAQRPELLYNRIECDRFAPTAEHGEQW